MNTQSSTEMELITADMFMPEMLWSLHFIQAQGYKSECMGLSIPGQHQHATIIEEQKDVGWKENKAHQSKVFL
jgi:hypothetical protein